QRDPLLPPRPHRPRAPRIRHPTASRLPHAHQLPFRLRPPRRHLRCLQQDQTI
ncbi:hypothetical protein HK101_006235, partial [Irineochytrium annulatum]